MEHADRKGRRGAPWLTWLLGAALLVAVILAALRSSEERAFFRIAERARPAWVAVAVLLQMGTYLAQGGVWRRVGAAAGHPVPLGAALELSLAKLFADQVLPSAGVSSGILIAKALEKRRMPSAAVQASVVINAASYPLAYVIMLGAALTFLAWRRETSAPILVAPVTFLVLSLALGATVLVLAGRRHDRLERRLDRVPLLRRTIAFIAGADPRLVRSPRLLAEAIGLQGAIMLLDAATLWTLIGALGVRASVPGVFASFMVSSLMRTIGIVPGGLGTFEATSVLTLRWTGVDLAVALAATLLFRVLTFWLPMLPGYWCSRRAAEPRVPDSK